MQSGSQSNILGLEICAPLMNIRHRTHSIRSYPIQVLQKGFGINFGVRTPTPGAEASKFWTGHRDGMGLLCQNEVGSQRGMAGFRSGGPVWHSTFPNKNAGSGYDWMRLVRECCCRLFFFPGWSLSLEWRNNARQLSAKVRAKADLLADSTRPPGMDQRPATKFCRGNR